MRGPHVKIAFLLYNAFGIGGTIRSTTNLSRALSSRHEVELVSVYRPQDTPRLPLGPDVRLTCLIDWRPESAGYDGGHPSAAAPSAMFEDEGVSGGSMAPSRLTDERVAAYLEGTDADVVIATRPVLNGYLARHGQKRYLRVGQEHLLLRMHGDQRRTDQNAALAELDAFVTVSEADAADYRRALPDVRTRITCIPNCSPRPEVTPSTGDSRTIVAAGRLISLKRYDRLLDAFAKVVAARPDWRLRIYGRGQQKPALRERIEELGLSDTVRLMGAVSPIEPEWAKGAIAAVSSDFESFGMTILEAMHCGAPVVATDCPYGPGEIITHGENGLLSPLDGGADAYADALLRLIDDPQERRRLAAAAQHRVADYAPDAVARQYEELFDGLTAGRGGGKAGARLRGLGTRLRRTVRANRSGDAAEAAPEVAAAPTARCSVTRDGSLSVTVEVAPQPEPRMDLLLRLRKDKSTQIRLPMTRNAAGRFTATVERSAHHLAEGRWDCYVVPRGQGVGKRQRLESSLVEQAALLALPPVVDAQGLSAWIPYPTTDGYLAVRTWLRAAHAEVEEVTVSTEAVTVTAALLAGPTPDAEARAVAVFRDEPSRAVELPVDLLEDGRFTCRLPLTPLLEQHAGGQSVWDLALRPRSGAESVPLGRITGDTVDRKTTDVFPGPVFPRPGDAALRARPFFTVNNALAVSVKDYNPWGIVVAEGSSAT